MKTELMKRAFEARPNATPTERLLIAQVIDLAYPTPILHAMDWDTN
jgi:hypothetical protein